MEETFICVVCLKDIDLNFNFLDSFNYLLVGNTKLSYVKARNIHYIECHKMNFHLKFEQWTYYFITLPRECLVCFSNHVENTGKA